MGFIAFQEEILAAVSVYHTEWMYLKKEGKKEMKRGYGKEVYCDKQVYFLHEIMTKNKKRDATSITFLQHFYNK